MSIITTEFGLLDELVSNHVLTYKQVSLIRGKNSNTEQVESVLEGVTYESSSMEKIAAFLNSLGQAQQKHVSQYIRGRGKHAVEYEDDWPLYVHGVRYSMQQGICSEECRTMSDNRLKLIELIDPRNAY